MPKRRIFILTVFSALILTPQIRIRAQATTPVVYNNKQYGFTFTLPASWKGYTIQTTTWQGTGPSGLTDTIEHGPALLIRNPQWTQADPHEDIPIWIFTHDQWNRIENAVLN